MIGLGCQIRRNCFRNLVIMTYISTTIYNMNLLLGTVVAIQTWVNLKNNYEKTYDWGKKDYKLWFMITFLSIVLTFASNFVISLESFFVTLYCLIRIHMKLISLDQSATYILNSKKLRSYILVFIFQSVSFF